MCYPKPGPRCSGHAKQALVEALESKNPSRIRKAIDDYRHTTAGIEETRRTNPEFADILARERQEMIEACNKAITTQTEVEVPQHDNSEQYKEFYRSGVSNYQLEAGVISRTPNGDLYFSAGFDAIPTHIGNVDTVKEGEDGSYIQSAIDPDLRIPLQSDEDRRSFRMQKQNQMEQEDWDAHGEQYQQERQARQDYLHSMDAKVHMVGAHGVHVMAARDAAADREARQMAAGESGYATCMDCGEPMTDYAAGDMSAPDYCDSCEGDHEDD